MSGRRADWIGRVAVLLVLAALAAGTALLAALAQQGISRAPPIPEAAPVTFIESGSLTTATVAGQAEYQIVSPQIIQLKNGELQLIDPDLRSRATAEANGAGAATRTIELRAAIATINAAQTEADLQTAVLMRQFLPDGTLRLQIESDQLTLDLTTGSAQTDGPVRVTQGGRILTGVGLRYDHTRESVEVLSEVRVELPT